MQKSKFELRNTIKAKDMIEKKIKRGRKSWDFVYIIYGVVLAIILFFIGILPVNWCYKLIISIIALFILTWLCFLNAWFQNKIIGIKIKLESTWRKI